MKVFAFIGSSGTGKSHRALVVAHSHAIECIIDDGILIFRNKIVAGTSAKKEESRLKAVRRAIFQDPGQVKDVQQALEKIKPNSLLILGTSENMAKKIAKAIGISPPSEYIHIEDVASKDDIAKAQESRLKEGKHIIPVPTMELRPHFRGYIIDPIKSIFRKKRDKNKYGDSEKSVVRPVFSYYGKLTFSNEVISSLICYAMKKLSGIIAVDEINIKKSQKENNGLAISLSVTIVYGENVKKLMRLVKNRVQEEIEYITGMSVDILKISIKGVSQRR